jgi:isocitrate dehydrogenase
VFLSCVWNLFLTCPPLPWKGDFYATEQSVTIGDSPTSVTIEHVAPDGTVITMKNEVKLQAKEVIDSACMRIKDLVQFFEDEIDEAKEAELMLSLHLKATMMKISDPIMFGHCVKVFFKAAFEKHGDTFKEIGANPNNGLAAVIESVKSKLPAAEADAILKDIEACYEDRPWLAMVNSDKGITNLHTPSDIIIDASMPVVVRDSGMMWNKDNELEDVKVGARNQNVLRNSACAMNMYASFLNRPLSLYCAMVVLDSRQIVCHHVPGGAFLRQDNGTI